MVKRWNSQDSYNATNLDQMHLKLETFVAVGNTKNCNRWKRKKKKEKKKDCPIVAETDFSKYLVLFFFLHLTLDSTSADELYHSDS